MYIYPNTDIRILSGVPLNNDYDNVMYFGTLTQQTNYFLGKTKYTLSNQSYQRKERGWLKVNVPQNNLWDCSYLMYRNTSFGTKWFYAFILSVEYVNNETSLINFEIDVMQTWFFDYTLEPCFVEREHSETDELFENTVEEHIDMGIEYNAQIRRKYDLTPNAVVAIELTDRYNVPITPTVQGNIISGLGYVTCRSNEYSQFINHIKEFITAGLQDNILAIFQVPDFMTRQSPLATVIDDYYDEIYTPFTPNFVNIDGYIPKNKKLFCYPYNYMEVSDLRGGKRELKWEFWNANHVGEMHIRGCIFGKPTIMTFPDYYRDISNDVENSICFDDFPTVSWVGDAYQVWLAQHTPDFVGKLIANTLTAPLNPADSISQIGGNIVNIITESLRMRRMPQTPHGSQNTEVISTQSNSLGFYYTQYTVRNEYARIIDEYFSRFGYACHRTKIPNRNARQNWTYTKTVGCEINASIPVDDAVKIKQIYDHGVTFWNNPNNIGNFGDFTNPTYS